MAMNKKDEALRIAARGFLIIRFGGTLTQSEAKTFADLCCLALPMKYRFEKQELVNIEGGVRLTLAERAGDAVCLTCMGHGWVEHIASDHVISNGKCPDCHGTGKQRPADSNEGDGTR
jgi:hypothetical protein